MQSHARFTKIRLKFDKLHSYQVSPNKAFIDCGKGSSLNFAANKY